MTDPRPATLAERLAGKLRGPLGEPPPETGTQQSGSQAVPRREEAPVPEGDRVDRLRKSTESVIALPTLPTITSQMIQLVDNPNTTAQTLARLIAQDQVLTARILKLANSAYYGFPRRISTVNLAVVVLGFNTVKDIGLSVSVMDMFKRTSRDPRFDISRFWEHCMAVAVATRHLARSLRYRLAGEAFTTGLLHDLGKVVLNQYQPREFDEILRRTFDLGEDQLEAERAVLGATHAQVGQWLAEKWNLPPVICEAIGFHHNSEQAEKNPDLAALVQLADLLVRHQRIGYTGSPADLEAVSDSFLHHLAVVGIAVQREDLPELADQVRLEHERSSSFREAFE